jgi:hypothetical protein
MNTRKKNENWRNCNDDGSADWDHAKIAVLMDIRDELQQINRFLGCYRILKALDGMIEMGIDLRRKKRAAAAKRKNAKKNQSREATHG